MRIDLHTHSNASDGTESPAQLMHSAAAAGLDVVALTDHDTTSGWHEAAGVVSAGVALVRGTEISTEFNGVRVHLLSYLHDPDHPALTTIFTRARQSRQGRAQAMATKLAQDLELTWQDVQDQAQPGATIGRPHLADALVARGHVSDRAEAFATYLQPNGPYYVSHWAPSTIEAVQAVRSAGGVPVVAHVRAAARGRIIDIDAIRALAAAGLGGIEIDHPDHTDDDRDVLRALAGELDLIVTGSSDYHGTGKPNRLGQCTSSERALAAIAEQGWLPVLWPA